MTFEIWPPVCGGEVNQKVAIISYRRQRPVTLLAPNIAAELITWNCRGHALNSSWLVHAYTHAYARIHQAVNATASPLWPGIYATLQLPIYARKHLQAYTLNAPMAFVIFTHQKEIWYQTHISPVFFWNLILPPCLMFVVPLTQVLYYTEIS